uniref:Putative secreted protein n=1 Tax=Ixodes ricinus TaxID=34613 RepID=A0A090XE93_IXORI
MYRITCAILFAGFIAASTCLSVAREDGDLLDALAHKDTKKLGEEAIQLGEILRKCAKNSKNEPTIEEFPGDEAEEHFSKNLGKYQKQRRTQKTRSRKVSWMQPSRLKKRSRTASRMLPGKL